MSEAIVERSIFGFPIRKTLMTALIAGAVSLTVWEIWRRFSRLFIWAVLCRRLVW